MPPTTIGLAAALEVIAYRQATALLQMTEADVDHQRISGRHTVVPDGILYQQLQRKWQQGVAPQLRSRWYVDLEFPGEAYFQQKRL